jgi:hypothetical protein
MARQASVHPGYLWKIEIEKRKEYPKHEYQNIKMKETEYSLWPHIFHYREPKL